MNVFAFTNWDTHGSHGCYNYKKKKNLIMCMHDDSKQLIKFKPNFFLSLSFITILICLNF